MYITLRPGFPSLCTEHECEIYWPESPLGVLLCLFVGWSCGWGVEKRERTLCDAHLIHT